MKMKRIISLAIALLLVCGMPVSAFADTVPDCGADDTVETIDSGDTMNKNYGTVEINGGTIETNYGTVDVNSGTVETNYCIVHMNNGTVTTNESSGTVDNNFGTVDTNNGTVGKNEKNGFIVTNNSTGTVDKNLGFMDINNGTVSTNSKTGSVTSNYSTVTTNDGHVFRNEIGGTVTTNNNYIETNNGTVTTNNGNMFDNSRTVDINNGTVTRNYGTVETNNITGTVNNRGNGTVDTNYGTVNEAYGSTHYGVQIYNDGNVTLEQKEKGNEIDFSQLTKDGYEFAGYTQEYQMLNGVLTKQSLTVNSTSYTADCPNILTLIWRALTGKSESEGEGGYFGPGCYISVNGKQYILVEIKDENYYLASCDEYTKEQLSDIDALLASLLTEEQLDCVTGAAEVLNAEQAETFFGGGSHIVFPCSKYLIFS